MLYIDNIDNNSLSFGNALGGGTYSKVLSKNLEARKDELDRIWIAETVSKLDVLNCYPVSDITLEGTVYPTATAFVVAFNNLVGDTISGSGGSVLPEIFNTPGAGTITNSTKIFAANTIKSLTATCISGSAVITIGASNMTIDAGQTFTWTADGFIDTAITINTTGGASHSVDYVTIGAAVTTTTSLEATTTTTPVATTTTTPVVTTTTTPVATTTTTPAVTTTTTP